MKGGDDPQKKPKKNKQVSSKEEQDVKNAYELVRIRNNFYRDNYRRLIGLLLFLSIATFILTWAVIYLYKNQPAPRYFATNIQGQLIDLVPLNQPSLNQAELLEWARRAAVSSFTFNYVQYREQLETTKDTYFTQQGGQDYLQQLDLSGTLARIKQAQLIMTAEPTAAPTLVQSGVFTRDDIFPEYKGHYFWQVAIPLKVTEQNPNTLLSKSYDIQLMIVRSSPLVDTRAVNLDAAKGIGIQQLIIPPPMNTAT